MLVGISCFLVSETASFHSIHGIQQNKLKFQIPNAQTVVGLLIPHFSLGLGIGTLDAALIPYMATLVDLKYSDDESTGSESQ